MDLIALGNSPKQQVNAINELIKSMGNGGQATIPIFMDTREKYEAANAKGEIATGTLVIITDEYDLDENTSNILGEAILGQLILG